MLNLEMFWLISSNILPGKDLYIAKKNNTFAGILQEIKKIQKQKKTSPFGSQHGASFSSPTTDGGPGDGLDL